jgi:hypothetical protein
MWSSAAWRRWRCRELGDDALRAGWDVAMAQRTGGEGGNGRAQRMLASVGTPLGPTATSVNEHMPGLLFKHIQYYCCNIGNVLPNMLILLLKHV